MRVISGSAKGILLAVPRRTPIRPTSDRAKQVLFDTLQSLSPIPARVLDLFAGSGALGIEALSRGAQSATFIEMCRDVALTLEMNLKKTHLQPYARVLVEDAFVVLGHPAERKFDLVLADPPYAMTAGNLSAVLAASSSWLNSNGLVILEHARRTGVQPPAALLVLKEKIVGDTSILFLRKK